MLPVRVGLAGLGRMGAALVPHLLRGCSSVCVWNRSPEKCADAVRAGAGLAISPSELVQNADIILSILYDDDAVTSVYCGPRGVLAGDCSGKVFVEMSTIKPQTTRTIAEEVTARGASFLDAPVSGTVGPARDGVLVVVAGGAQADLERVHPVLSLFSRRIIHMGPVGCGIAMKLSLQLPIYAYWLSLAEALNIGVRSGLQVADMLEVIADSSAALAMLRPKIPTILGDNREAAFALSAAAKDLAVIEATAAALDTLAPVALSTSALYRTAAEAGWGECDVAQIVSFLLQREQDR